MTERELDVLVRNPECDMPAHSRPEGPIEPFILAANLKALRDGRMRVHLLQSDGSLNISETESVDVATALVIRHLRQREADLWGGPSGKS